MTDKMQALYDKWRNLGTSHSAPEGMLTGVIALLTFGVEVLVFCALFATWVAPLLATAVLGPDRRRTANPARSTAAKYLSPS